MQWILLKLVDQFWAQNIKHIWMNTQDGVFIDKKQRLLDEETKALGKLMADNLGLMVATLQHRHSSHHREQ